MSSCAFCDMPFERGDNIITCHICNDLFHARKECTGSSASEIKILERKNTKLMLFRCKQCFENSGENPGVVELLKNIDEKLLLLNAHDKEIKIHSSEISELKSKVLSLENSLKDTTEMNDRNKRSMNVLFFNVAEQVDGNDKDLIIKALSDIKIDTIIAQGKMKRLGKKTENNSRPILFRLDHRSDVINILKNWKKVKNGVKVSSDLTPLQKSMYKKLKDDAKKWNSTNQDHKKIVIFVKGDPTLVDARPNTENISPNLSNQEN